MCLTGRGVVVVVVMFVGCDTGRYKHVDRILTRPSRFAEDFTPGEQVGCEHLCQCIERTGGRRHCMHVRPTKGLSVHRQLCPPPSSHGVYSETRK